MKELAALPAKHSFIDALEALIEAAAFGSLARARIATLARRRGASDDALPMMEIAAHTPGTVADIRLSGTATGMVASVRYTLPDLWEERGSKRPSKAEIGAWEAGQGRLQDAGDLEQYRRISEETMLKLAQALADRKEAPR